MINKPLMGVAAAVVIIAAGSWYFLHSRSAVRAPPPTLASPAPAAAVESGIAHPLPQGTAAGAAMTPLPALNESDGSINEALAQLAGASVVADYLVPESLIRHLVVTIDNLPRQKVAVQKRPTRPLSGAFVAEGDELHATVDPQNYARYQPMVAVIRQLDMQKLAALYIHFYPLFQQAYQDLGYPSAYFNDRVVNVIDLLLASPQPQAPIELVRPNVMYLYADPALEKLPAGQKLLIRMGPENAASIKAKLKELRTVIAATPPRH